MFVLPAPSLPQSYWVRPGQLMAGEYPGDKYTTTAREKLTTLLQLGIDTFVDLTKPGELVAYDALLYELAQDRGKSVAYHRLPITDVSVPDSKDEMVRILDTIDSAIQSGHIVYVHCWGGVGRTGTVVGCHLSRYGIRGQTALDEVARLFKGMPKSEFRESPENEKQCHWVRQWNEVHRGEHQPTSRCSTQLHLRRLLQTNSIKLQDAPLLKTMPRLQTMDRERLWDKVEGMLLGLAIGDALGNTTESINPTVRRERYGEIRDYLPNRYANNEQVGLPSDDTQLAFWTLEQLLADDGLVPENLARRLTQGRIYGIGRTVRQFIGRHKDEGIPWDAAGVNSAGNGSLMRIAPILIPHLRTPTPELWADAAIASMITHNDLMANASCVTYISLLWDLLGMREPPEDIWWAGEFALRLHGLEGPDALYVGRTPFVLEQIPLTQVIRAGLSSLRGRQRTIDICNELYSGAYLLETVPCALIILERYSHDPEEAIVRAVNDTHDNDTIAAIVGAAVGALHGRSALPRKWIDGLLGRTAENDNGRIFELINAARERWG